MSKAKKQAAPEIPFQERNKQTGIRKALRQPDRFSHKRKKLVNRLEKVSKRLASDIVKTYRKETPKSDKTAPAKKSRPGKRKPL